MNEYFLTKQQCLTIRAFAILGIILHNYTHWLPGIVKENEFTYSFAKNIQLWNAIKGHDETLFLHLLSYFGHYGVVLFLFLSGFGLVMKYEKNNLPIINILNFIRYNYLKLFRIFIVGFTAFIIVDTMTSRTHQYTLHHVIALFGMFANVLQEPSRIIWPGPYWYFGITLQLYIIYHLFMYRNHHWFLPLFLILICLFWQTYYKSNNEVLEYLRYNFVGGLLPFCIGVLLGRHIKNIQFNQFVWFVIFLLSSVMIVLLCFNFIGWLFIPVFVVFGMISLVKVLSEQTMKYMSWLGGLSATLFVMHPLVRKILIYQYNTFNMYSGLLLYVVICISLSYFVQKIIIEKIPTPKL